MSERTILYILKNEGEDSSPDTVRLLKTIKDNKEKLKARGIFISEVVPVNEQQGRGKVFPALRHRGVIYAGIGKIMEVFNSVPKAMPQEEDETTFLMRAIHEDMSDKSDDIGDTAGSAWMSKINGEMAKRVKGGQSASSMSTIPTAHSIPTTPTMMMSSEDDRDDLLLKQRMSEQGIDLSM